jgi:indolepyruvate ferredoxin oxidoreductase beta subunit
MMLEKDPFNVIITGVGGQGNVLASKLLGQILVHQGYIITIGETYGASQRGGSVMSHLRISHNEQFSPLIPEGRCDLLIGLEPVEAVRVLGHYGNPNILIIVNMRPIYPVDVIAGDKDYPDISIVLEKINRLSRRAWTVNATDIALEMENPVVSNVVIIGALASLNLLPIDNTVFLEAMHDILPPHQLDLNIEAFNKGKDNIQELSN